MTKKQDNPKVNIDGTEYDLDQLSDKVKNMLGFIQRLDKEATEMRFQLDKSGLARKQAILDLKAEVGK
jgi:TolA-binding protein